VVALAKGFKPHRVYFEIVADEVTGLSVQLDEPPQIRLHSMSAYRDMD